MLGYWEQPAEIAEVIDQARWMHTGDVAVMDSDGYLNITGRIKDMVIRGGENIYPREIEEFLYTHPDILDAQVIGVPDAHYGEELCAWYGCDQGRPNSPPRHCETADRDMDAYRCQGRWGVCGQGQLARTVDSGWTVRRPPGSDKHPCGGQRSARNMAGGRKVGATRPGCARGAFGLLVAHSRQAEFHEGTVRSSADRQGQVV